MRTIARVRDELFVKLFIKGTRLKGLDWCNKHIGERETFDNRIFNDELTVQLECQ